MEGASADGIQVRGNFANAEFAFCAVAGGASDFKFHLERIEIRFSHLRGPPKAGIREDELLEFVRGEGNVLRFVGRKLHILFEVDVFDCSFQLALTG